MIAKVARNDTTPSEDGTQDEEKNSGDIELTFSAPFYTGVFLSSRELQGDYEYRPQKTASEAPPQANPKLAREEDYVCHQKIVINEMKKKGVSWGWSMPPDVTNFWDRTVSPPYFIGCSETARPNVDMHKVNLTEVFIKIKDGLSAVEEIDLSECGLIVKSLDVKFFEFGFGSVSIQLKGLKLSKDAIDLAKNCKDFWGKCEKEVRNILNCIAKKASEAYRSSVPCCIKNSDIWDIDNFAGLATDVNICRVGEVQSISVVTVIDEKCCEDFRKLKNELGDNFLSIFTDLNEISLNSTYRLFSDENNITIALDGQKIEDELDDLFDTAEMVGVYLAVGKYFDNFFYSYFNYVSSEYEIIASKNLYRVPNIKRLRNLMEQFYDIETLYSQLCLKKQQMSDHCINLYKDKLYNFSHQLFNVEKFWENLDKLYIRLKDKHETINKITSQNSFLASLDTAYIAVLLAAVTPIVYIRLESNSNIFGVSQLFFAIYIFILTFAIVTIYNSGRVVKRKLYYICGLQKKEYRQMFKDQKRYNKDKKACVCKVKGCHRCRGEKWHPRVFYRDVNLCSRCGINFVRQK